MKAYSASGRLRTGDEVFTPADIVCRMCDMLEQENPDAFAPETTFLEPTCGEGAFVLEILRRKFVRCRGKYEYRTALRSVYGMELQADNVAVCIESVTALCEVYWKLSKEDRETIADHIIQCDSLKVMRMMDDLNRMEARKCE